MTSTEIDLRAQPSLLEQKVMYSRWLAKSGLLPVDYRGHPENILLAIEYGEALGIKPMTAINMINVIQGRPAISAGLMAALVRQAGHRLRIEVDPVNKIATAMLWRADDPEFGFTATWDVDRATKAGLASKDNWKHYLLNMLKARAISEVCRDACPEVLAGIAYTPDELGERFLTDTERDDMGLMTRSEATDHLAVESIPHDSSKTVRIRADDPDPDGGLWESPPDDTGDVPDAE